jgi:hypothetical protein
MRPSRLVTVAAVAVVSSTLSVLWTHLLANASPPVPHYTGCLGTSGTGAGTISKVAIGTAPRSACSSSQTRIQFSDGTVTGVNAGTGLTGGGTNGNLTVRVGPAYRLPQGCQGGQAAASDGSNSWGCADLLHGSGVVDHGSTTVTAGVSGQFNFTENALGQFSGACDPDQGAEIFFDTKLAVSSRIVWWNKDGYGSTEFQGAQVTPQTKADYAATVQVLWADGQVETAFVTQHVDTGTGDCTFTGQETLG